MPNIDPNHPAVAALIAAGVIPDPAANDNEPAPTPPAPIANSKIADMVAAAKAKLPAPPPPPPAGASAAEVKRLATAASDEIKQAAEDAADCVKACFALGLEYAGNGITVSKASGGVLRFFASELHVDKLADQLVAHAVDGSRIFADVDVKKVAGELLALVTQAAS
jgi:hypothetical protein